MIVRAQHLHDDALFECYYATRRGEAVDPPSAEHLADCSACASRYAELGSFLNGLTEDAEADVDALFTPERLHTQQLEITRRLQLIGRAARVITFPGRAAGQSEPLYHERSASRVTMRWIAVAAAAGLFVGIAATAMFNFGPRSTAARDARRGVVTTVSRQAASTPSRLSPGVEKAVADDMDDMFMSDLESVLDRPHNSELVAFDALTPHLREVRDSAR